MMLKYWWWIKRRRVNAGIGTSMVGVFTEGSDLLLTETGDFLAQE
jgi:hypothetical protein